MHGVQCYDQFSRDLANAADWQAALPLHQAPEVPLSPLQHEETPVGSVTLADRPHDEGVLEADKDLNLKEQRGDVVPLCHLDGQLISRTASEGAFAHRSEGARTQTPPDLQILDVENWQRGWGLGASLGGLANFVRGGPAQRGYGRLLRKA